VQASMNVAEKEARLADLFGRQAVQDCLLRAALGNDLQDAALWKSAYWPDATEDHGWYQGNAHAFIDETVPLLLETMDETWHQVGNMIVRIDGDRACAQSYFFAYCRVKAAGDGRSDLFAGGRCVDRLERRSDEWRIAARITKGDWVRQATGSADWSTPVLQGYVPKYGLRAPDDPFWRVFGRRLHPQGDQ
jgi:hypothetical protein